MCYWVGRISLIPCLQGKENCFLEMKSFPQRKFIRKSLVGNRDMNRTLFFGRNMFKLLSTIVFSFFSDLHSLKNLCSQLENFLLLEQGVKLIYRCITVHKHADYFSSF